MLKFDSFLQIFPATTKTLKMDSVHNKGSMFINLERFPGTVFHSARHYRIPNFKIQITMLFLNTAL